jgi:hypothetical protein
VEDDGRIAKATTVKVTSSGFQKVVKFLNTTAEVGQSFISDLAYWKQAKAAFVEVQRFCSLWGTVLIEKRGCLRTAQSLDKSIRPLLAFRRGSDQLYRSNELLA